jgi:peroxiredoxin
VSDETITAALEEDEDAISRLGLRVRVGDPMPSVGLRASDGYLLNLRSFVGRQPAVLLFFAAPTAEGARRRRGARLAQSLAGGARRLAGLGSAVVGVTCDNERTQAEWMAETHFPFLLFSDERRAAVDRLGVPVDETGGRYNVEHPLLFVLGRDGIIDAILVDPDPEYAVDIALAAVRRAEGRAEDDAPGGEGAA